MPNEMNHAEVEKILDQIGTCMECGTDQRAIGQAAADECRIANRELVPMVHAKWNHNRIDVGGCECNSCKYIRWGESLYCPNCGARMDGKDGGEK